MIARNYQIGALSGEFAFTGLVRENEPARGFARNICEDMTLSLLLRRHQVPRTMKNIAKQTHDHAQNVEYM